MNIICYQCGKVFNGRSNSKFCSRKCSHISSTKKITKKCLCCGKEMKIKYSEGGRKKYCSKQCMNKFRATIKKRACLQCGMFFKPTKNSVKCCSKSCASKYKLKNKETKEKIFNNLRPNEKHTDKTKKKLRKIRIQQISDAKFNGHQVIPSWNPKACDYFEQFDKDNNTSGHHARNGGEFHIKELGYWVDYINHDLK